MKRVKNKISYPSKLTVITCAASLAHHGLIGSLWDMILGDVDLTSVPTDHLTSLVSSVTERFSIQNVSGCDLVSVLDSVKSNCLNIIRQNLDSEETQALVRTMESRVITLQLNKGLTLDIRDLRGYSGQGKCKRLECYGDAQTKYSYQLRIWSTCKNWRVTFESFQYFKIESM